MPSPGLEGLCNCGIAIRSGIPAEGVERLEARLLHRAFSPHRHDTYGIGLTLAGIQSFRYRGVLQRCLPGQLHVLHPDELHDGAQGDDRGFAYRILHLDPALIAEAIGYRPLPFVPDPIMAVVPGRLRSMWTAWDLKDQLDEFDRTDLVVELADFLIAASGSPPAPPPRDVRALRRVRDLLEDMAGAKPSAEALESASGLDRWSIARSFRAHFGTSPSRFRVMRQLDVARSLMLTGYTLAETALEAGFADQSHLSRHFKRAFGLTPARWRAAVFCAATPNNS